MESKVEERGGGGPSGDGSETITKAGGLGQRYRLS